MSNLLERLRGTKNEPTAEGDDASVKPSAGPASVTLTLRDLLVVTHAVPADKVRAHVPEGLPLDLLPSEEGERMAFVQTVCAFHEDARWALLPEGAGQSFRQMSHRILTRREGRRGAFTLRTYLETQQSYAAQRAVSRDADFARFTCHIAGDPARGTYHSYTIRAVGDVGQAALSVTVPHGEAPAPLLPVLFGSEEELGDFLLRRGDMYFRASAPKTGVGVQSFSFGSGGKIVRGELASARLSLWTELGILDAEALLQPFAVLIQPSILVSSTPPRFARFDKGEKSEKREDKEVKPDVPETSA